MLTNGCLNFGEKVVNDFFEVWSVANGRDYIENYTK